MGYPADEFKGVKMLHKIDDSQTRWKKIITGKNNNYYLCMLSGGGLYPHPFPTIKCKDCFIYDFTGKFECKDTPFEKWRQHHWEKHSENYRLVVTKIECPECTELAIEVLDFLKLMEEEFRLTLLG